MVDVDTIDLLVTAGRRMCMESSCIGGCPVRTEHICAMDVVTDLANGVPLTEEENMLKARLIQWNNDNPD